MDGLSRGGEVKGKLIYANYGRQEDYKALVESGESLPLAWHLSDLPNGHISQVSVSMGPLSSLAMEVSSGD